MWNGWGDTFSREVQGELKDSEEARRAGVAEVPDDLQWDGVVGAARPCHREYFITVTVRTAGGRW